LLTALEAHVIDEADVSGSFVAEGTARAVCLLSFIFLYEKHPVNQRRSCYFGGEYMEREAVVFHFV